MKEEGLIFGPFFVSHIVIIIAFVWIVQQLIEEISQQLEEERRLRRANQMERNQNQANLSQDENRRERICLGDISTQFDISRDRPKWSGISPSVDLCASSPSISDITGASDCGSHEGDVQNEGSQEKQDSPAEQGPGNEQDKEEIEEEEVDEIDALVLCFIGLPMNDTDYMLSEVGRRILEELNKDNKKEEKEDDKKEEEKEEKEEEKKEEEKTETSE